MIIKNCWLLKLQYYTRTYTVAILMASNMYKSEYYYKSAFAAC